MRRHRPARWWAIPAVILTWAVVNPCPAAQRVALVIGNSNYAGAMSLRNPVRDADAISAALRELGFTVVTKKDVDLAAMEAAVVAFRRKLSKGDLALFYYAGHGLQVRGENYLVPVGAHLREEFEVKRQCLEVGQVLDAMAESESSMKVLVLDCCRDNPLKRGWSRSASGQGLAGISSVPEGTVIAFATAPNSTAADGEGANSPYAEKLVTALRSRPPAGLELSEVFREASRQVKRQTGQVPWLNMEASLEKCYLWRAAPSTTPAAAAVMTPVEKPALRTLTNSIGMKLVQIPAGDFWMGSPDGEGDADEHPRHRVRITRPFHFGVYEVTQEEYQRVVGKNPSHFSASGDGRDKVTELDTRRFPVESVTWHAAQAFCKALSSLPAEKAAGRLYGLPTEAQWEYACRAGSDAKYSFGDAETQLSGYGWSEENSDGRTHQVGEKRPNRFGLYDMHGNVWEWCAPWKGLYENTAVDDPQGPESGTSRVGRGGSWSSPAQYCRSAYRGNDSPEYRNLRLGFRVVMLPAE